MAPPPEDGSPGGVTLVQVLWGAAALLGILWGLLLGLVGWVFRMVWAEIKGLRDRVHYLEGENKAQGSMVRDLWSKDREKEKERE